MFNEYGVLIPDVVEFGPRVPRLGPEWIVGESYFYECGGDQLIELFESAGASCIADFLREVKSSTGDTDQ